MNRFLLILVAPLAAGCDYIYDYTTNNYYEVVEDTGSEADTAVNDTASDDTAVEDTAIEDDTGTEPMCEFEVATATGTAIITNELIVYLDEESPSGTAVPGYQEVLTIDISVAHKGCPSLGLTWHELRVSNTDMDNNGWLQTMIDAGVYGYWDDGEFATYSDPRNAPEVGTEMHATLGFSPIVAPDESGALQGRMIEGGETVTVHYYADTTGASTIMDDMLRFDLMIEVGIWDGTNNTDVYIPVVMGNTLVF